MPVWSCISAATGPRRARIRSRESRRCRPRTFFRNVLECALNNSGLTHRDLVLDNDVDHPAAAERLAVEMLLRSRDRRNQRDSLGLIER